MTETALEEQVNITSEDKGKIAIIKSKINIENSINIIEYGTSTQKEVSDFSGSVLRNKDTGEVGELITNLMLQAKELDIEKLGDDSFLGKIPLLKKLVSTSEKVIAKYDTVEKQIDKIVNELEKNKIYLKKDIIMFDELYKKTLSYFKEISLYILAGEEKIRELNLEAEEMKNSMGDSMEQIQKYKDFVNSIANFEKKIHDLKLTRTIILQSAPQIKLIQNGNQILVEKIQTSIVNTIPLWKSQIVIAIGLTRQKKALEIQKSVNKTTNDLLLKNSEMLKTGTIEIAKESERGIVELETLKKTHQNLLTTLDETLRIQAEGRTNRQNAEVELRNMENELKNKLSR